MSVEYDLCRLAEGYRSSWDESTLITALRTEYYGALLEQSQLETRAALLAASQEQSVALAPFDVLKVVGDALHNQGYYPSVQVPGAMLPDPPPLPSLAEDGPEGEELPPAPGPTQDDQAFSDSDEDYVDFGLDEEMESEAVSYTHLTLPTKA